MGNKDLEMKRILRNAYLAAGPMILRDMIFRASLLGVYYGTTDIKHKPTLKFTMPEIMHYLRYRRSQGYNESYNDMKHLFFEWHNYEVHTKSHFRFLLMLLANAVGTLITNPLDVCMTKILTQRKDKYNGLFDCMRKVVKEEGKYKLLSGIHPRFMFNSVNGCLFIYMYDSFIEKV